MNIDLEQLKPYFNGGLELIPLYAWNKQKIETVNGKQKVHVLGKSPISQWKTRYYENDKINNFAKKGHNVGFKIGPSQIIIDVDPRNFEKGIDSFQEMATSLGKTKNDFFDRFPTVETGGGGYHIYTKMPVGFSAKELKGVHDDWPGIEFKKLGNYVVTAGSKHPSGLLYEWDFSKDIPDLSDLPLFPKKLAAKLKRVAPSMGGDDATDLISCEALNKLLIQLPVENYNNNDAWFPILCASHSSTGGDGLEEFIRWSISDDDYSHDEFKIRARWESLENDSENKNTVATLYKEVLNYGGLTVFPEDEFREFADKGSEEKQDEWDFSEIKGMLNVEPGEAYDMALNLGLNSTDEAVEMAINAAGKAGAVEKHKSLDMIKEKTGLSKGAITSIMKAGEEGEDLGRMIAESTLKNIFHGGNGLVFNNNGEFWAYNGKYWSVVTRQYVGRQVLRILDKMRESVNIKSKETSLVSEVVSSLNYLRATKNDVLRMREKPYPVINCQNGELWINKKGIPELKPHMPKSYLKQVLNVKYDPGAECPMFDEAIRGTFGALDDCEDMVRHFEEFMGYTLHPDKKPASWWLFKGSGGNGKTTLMRILSALMGDSILPESLETFKKDNHAFANVVGKLLVYDDDIKRSTVLPDDILKKLSEDGELTANRKHIDGFKFVKVCSVVLLSNGYPKTKDLTEGFRRRAMVVPFNSTFHKNNDKGDIDIAEKIIMSELPGVLNRALQGLKRMKERKRFDEPLSCQIAKQEWLNESNSVAMFASEQIIKVDIDDIDETVKLGDMYRAFKVFCEFHGVTQVHTRQNFKTILNDMGYKNSVSANRIVRFHGVVIRDSELLEDFEGMEDEE